MLKHDLFGALPFVFTLHGVVIPIHRHVRYVYKVRLQKVHAKYTLLKKLGIDLKFFCTRINLSFPNFYL